MPRYVSKGNEPEYTTEDDSRPEDSPEHTGVEKDSFDETDDSDDFDNKCLISAITDEILFGS
ncbi:MAG: hypothetical protein ABFD12_10540 [Syntrophorhabdus sp.]